MVVKQAKATLRMILKTPVIGAFCHILPHSISSVYSFYSFGVTGEGKEARWEADTSKNAWS